MKITVPSAIEKLAELAFKTTMLYFYEVITKEDYTTIMKILGDTTEKTMKKQLED